MSCKVIWFTGLSGSGKTTLSFALNKNLKKLDYKVKQVDGDVFRKKNKNIKKFTKKNIIENNLSIINHINENKKNYHYIIVSVISPLIKTRTKAKNIFGKDYFEIYVKCSLKTLIRRDTKGLYKLAIKKKIKNLIGYNSKIVYEKSKYKKIIINSEKKNIKECIDVIKKKIL